MSDEYSKTEGRRELRSKQFVEIDETVGEEDLVYDVPNSYTKEYGDKDPSLFIIFSGGEKREKDYFLFFERKNENKSLFPRLKIVFIDRGEDEISGLSVNKLVDLALKKKEEIYSDTEGIEDKLYIVTDVDHFYKEIVLRQKECEDNNIYLIISNPCFELWLYYCYFEDKPDFEIPYERKKISKAFKMYLGNKKKGGVNPLKAPLELESAIINSKNNYSEDKNNIPSFLSTNMYELAIEFFKLISDDLEIYKNLQAEIRRSYIK